MFAPNGGLPGSCAAQLRTIQDLTFDCRWWADSHHHNGDECHGGLNLYIAATVVIVLAQIMVFAVSTQFLEDKYNSYYNKEPEMGDACCFGSSRRDGVF